MNCAPTAMRCNAPAISPREPEELVACHFIIRNRRNS